MRRRIIDVRELLGERRRLRPRPFQEKPPERDRLAANVFERGIAKHRRTWDDRYRFSR